MDHLKACVRLNLLPFTPTEDRNVESNMFLTAILFGADVIDTSLVFSGPVGHRMCVSGKTWLGETRMVCS